MLLAHVAALWLWISFWAAEGIAAPFPNVAASIAGSAVERWRDAQRRRARHETHKGAGNVAPVIANYRLLGEHVPRVVGFATLTKIH